MGYANFDVHSLGSLQSKEVERTFAPSLHPALGNGLLFWSNANLRGSVSCSCLGSHILGSELLVLLCIRKGDAAKTELCLGLRRVVGFVMVFPAEGPAVLSAGKPPVRSVLFQQDR